MLATEETKTVTVWIDNRGVASSNKRQAEMDSICHITKFAHELEDLDQFLRQMVTHHELRQWLLEQLDIQTGTEASNIVNMSFAFGAATRASLKGDAVHALDKISEMAIKRVMHELEAQGYQLIKK